MGLLIMIIVLMVVSLATTIAVARSEGCKQFLDRIKNF